MSEYVFAGEREGEMDGFKERENISSILTGRNMEGDVKENVIRGHA